MKTKLIIDLVINILVENKTGERQIFKLCSKIVLNFYSWQAGVSAPAMVHVMNIYVKYSKRNSQVDYLSLRYGNNWWK